MLGTLAARERRDPVVVVSGDRDLLQLVADDPVPVRVFYIGRGLAKATHVRTRRGRRAVRRARRPRGRRLRGTGAAARRSVRRSARCRRHRREDGGHAARPARLAGARSWRPPPTRRRRCLRAQRKKLLAATDYIAAAEKVVRVATDAKVTLSTASDVLPLTATHPRKVAELAGEYGVTSSIARLQKALDELPA